MTSNNYKVGIVGLGIMGKGMATNFLAKGFIVNVWNRTTSVAEELAAQGANIYSSPAEVCKNSDILFEVTANDESSRQVWLGPQSILAVADPSKILVTSATLSTTWIDELGASAKEAGLEFFDMPLTGGSIGAETGNLTLLVGGNPDILTSITPLLEAISAKVLHFGSVGQGTRYKLLLNMIQAIHVKGYGEVMKVAEANGMQTDLISKALVDRPGGVPTEIADACYKNQPDPISFSVKWITKDLTYAKELGAGIDTPLLDSTQQSFQNFLEAGNGDADWTAINEILSE